MNIGTPNNASLKPTPVPGTEAYWATQREAFTLIYVWQTTVPDDPGAELAALRRIAAHPFAAGVMHAHGRAFARWIRELEAMEAERYRNAAVTDRWDALPETEPKGDDWCPRGCQPLCHLGECGMCGYQGRGVAADTTDTVAEYCCHCSTRTYQDRTGICQLCGRDAEPADDGHCSPHGIAVCPADAPSAMDGGPAPMPPLGDDGEARDMHAMQQTP